MKKHTFTYQFLAIIIAILFVFRSLPEINSHSHSTGFSNVHQFRPNGITCFFAGPPIHMTYTCGKTFHL